MHNYPESFLNGDHPEPCWNERNEREIMLEIAHLSLQVMRSLAPGQKETEAYGLGSYYLESAAMRLGVTRKQLVDELAVSDLESQ